MDGNNMLLSELVFGTNWNTVRVRVARLWKLNSQGTNEVYALNMQFIDSEGNEKVASVRKHILRQFERVFEEPSVYDITRFNVQKAETTYRTVHDDWVIVLRTDTRAVKVADAVDTIPRYKFAFADENTLITRLCRIDNLTDLGGLLCAVTNVFAVTSKSGTQTLKRELHVESNSGNTSVVSLWGSQRDLIDQSVVDKFEHPPTVVVTSLTVATYGRAFTFNSTKATKVYLDIDLPELTAGKSRSNHDDGKKIEFIDHSASKRATVLDRITTTLTQVLNDVRSANCQGKIYVVPATIVKLKSSTWSYLSCALCKSMVHFEGTNYFCSGCHRMAAQPVNRYRLTVDILDSSTSTTITAFDKEAEWILGHKVEDMLAILHSENGVQKIENIFHHIAGSEAIFEFRPSNYEINNPDAYLTARKISKNVAIKETLTPSSDQSSTLDCISNTVNHTIHSNLDVKGKKQIAQDDVTMDHPPKRTSNLPLPRKTVRGRNAVQDDDMDQCAAAAPGIKLREKKQKN